MCLRLCRCSGNMKKGLAISRPVLPSTSVSLHDA
jgi:hypothetical protein